MARLPYPDNDSAPEPIREVLGRNPLSILRMVAHAEGAFDPWLQYTGTLLGGLKLDPLLRELAILQVASLRESEYQWVQHSAIARAVGATAEQVAAVKAGRDGDASLTEPQREVLRFAREVCLDGAASEASVAALARRLGAREVVELLLVIGQWQSICGLVTSLGLRPDLPAMADALPRQLALSRASSEGSAASARAGGS
jgi:alkylhydroperoxidase family enzyme